MEVLACFRPGFYSITAEICPSTLSRRVFQIANYYNKERYKIHRALQFSQEPWLKSYIDLNTTMRQDARYEFDKNFFKLMNNAVFGKTMKDVKCRRDIKLFT